MPCFMTREGSGSLAVVLADVWRSLCEVGKAWKALLTLHKVCLRLGKGKQGWWRPEASVQVSKPILATQV